MTNKRHNYCLQIMVRLIAKFIHEFNKKAQEKKNKYDKRHKRKVRKIKSEIDNNNNNKRRKLKNVNNKKKGNKKELSSWVPYKGRIGIV